MMKKVLPKVKKVINMSLKQAKMYGDDEVRIEHIIISLINDYNNNAVRILTSLGVDVDSLHKKIELSLLKEKKESTNPQKKELPLEYTTEKVLKGAEDECDSLGDDFLDTQHILLSSLKIKNGVGSLLKGMKISYSSVKKQMEKNLIQNSIDPVDSDDDNFFRDNKKTNKKSVKNN